MQPEEQALRPKERLFVLNYLALDFNGAAAVRAARYDTDNARQMAYEMVRKPHIKKAIAEAMREREARTEISADKLLMECWKILTADANELVSAERAACRYCHGKDHRYQFTAAELEKEREIKRELGQPFSEMGGIGFTPKKAPHEDCPECFGDGDLKVHVADTKKLSPEAAALYAGVKITKDGIEVKTHSKEKMIELMGKRLSLFTDKVTLKGDIENPLVALIKEVQGVALPVAGSKDDGAK